jgi:hypothetical protein
LKLFRLDFRVVNKYVAKKKEQPRTEEFEPPKQRWKGRRRGLFHPNNPEKYEGNIANIVYRSNLELRFMKYLDDHSSVIKWSSEEFVIPYISPKDNKYHRYFVDFKVTTKKKDGTTKTGLVELKWSTATVAPKKPKKQTRRYMRECYNWIINQAKWEAAKTLCDKKGWEWLILTEKDLKPTL